jgi:two-component system LytT family response regulator
MALMPLRTLIVDDEPVARRRLRRLLRHVPDAEVIAECGDGRAAIEAIEANEAGDGHDLDLVLLDVQMPDISGFDVVSSLGPRMPPVIFVTAFDHYARQAFDVHAVDYLLKPVTEARFQDAIARVRSHVGREEARALHQRLDAMMEALRSAGRYVAHIPVRHAGRIALVQVSEIERIQAADNYVTLHADGREYLLRETMAKLQQSLDPLRFVRIHRSTIVALDRVRELQPSFRGDLIVVLRDGTRLTLGRAYRASLEKALGRPL